MITHLPSASLRLYVPKNSPTHAILRVGKGNGLPAATTAQVGRLAGGEVKYAMTLPPVPGSKDCHPETCLSQLVIFATLDAGGIKTHG